jgi:hypothetical protein
MKRARDSSSSQTILLEDESAPKFTRYQNGELFPIDCLLSIFQFCDASELAYLLPRVCAVWNNTINENSNVLWKELCFKHWPILQTMVDEETFHITWKELYMKRGTRGTVELTNRVYCVYLCGNLLL